MDLREIPESVASKQAAIPAFEKAIAELERVAGDFLTGPGRLECLDAFVRDRAAFEFLVGKTLKRRDARSLLGLFVRIVKDEHGSVSDRLSRGHAPTTACPECGVGGGMHVVGCSVHTREAAA